jgi:hypothetical protein
MAAAIRWSPGLPPDFHAMEQAFVVGERQPHLKQCFLRLDEFMF